MESLQGLLDHGLLNCNLTAKELLAIVRNCSSEELETMGLGIPRVPALPPNLQRFHPFDRLKLIQEFIASFQYNHTPHQFASIAKNVPFCQLMATATSIINTALPIRCVEAVFLGLQLTCNWDALDRYPVGFKTSVQGEVYRHIVLVVHHKPSNLYGALGLSRRDSLMYKPLKFKSMGEVLESYKLAYEEWGHKVLKVRVGLPAPSDPTTTAPVCWRYCNLSVHKMEWSRAARIFDAFVAHVRTLEAAWKQNGTKKKPEEYMEEEGAAVVPKPPSSPSKSPRRARPRYMEPTGGFVVTGPYADGYASTSDDEDEGPAETAADVDRPNEGVSAVNNTHAGGHNDGVTDTAMLTTSIAGSGESEPESIAGAWESKLSRDGMKTAVPPAGGPE